MNFTLSDAAHKYALDGYSQASLSAEGGILGAVVSTTVTPSAAGIGQNVTRTLKFANGFYEQDVFNLTSTTVTTALSSTIYSPSGEVLASATGSVALKAATAATDFGFLSLTQFDDSFQGNSFNNTLQGNTGNDRIDGGAGTDTSVFSGRLAQYAASRSGSSITIAGPDGTDTLLNIERLQFDDYTVAYDTAGTAGQSYRLYQAAFNRTPDQVGLGYWTKAMDAGASLHDVAQSFVTSAEFSAKYGALDNSAFANQLYQNVLHRAADSSGVAYWINSLNAGTARADVLASFSESPENQAALIGTISGGMVYNS